MLVKGELKMAIFGFKEYKANVTRVIDGDTIEVLIDMGFGISYKAKLRFLDYDAPETFRPSCPEEKEAGEKAKEYLKLRITQHPADKDHWVTLRTYKDKRGKYGRILARIFIDDEDIIETMIEMGMVKKEEWKRKKIKK